MTTGGQAPGSASGSAGGPAAVETVAVRKSFGAIHAVDGVDVALSPGRVYGLLGPNGSGKTTLIRLMMGLTRATSGEVRVLGQRMPSRGTLSRIGYMTQADGIYPELSVWENIRFFAAMFGTDDRAALVRSLELVELADRLSTPAIELSGGLRRRLSLACALVHSPSVLFLDEPTVGIDPALRVQFWSHFRSLAAAGATILVSSHVMDEASRCDELLFMRAGRVIAQGDLHELRARAGTDDLEAAFLRLAGEATGPAGEPS